MPSRLRTVEGLAALMFVLVTFAGAGYPAEPRSKPSKGTPATRPQTAELVRRIEWPGIHVFHTAFSPDGRLYLGGGDSGTMRVWDAATGQQLHELPAPVGLFTPDGKHVLGHNEKTICLFDLTSGKEVRRWEPSEAVVGLAIAPEGKRFVSGHADNLLRLWDLAGDKELRGFEYPAEPGEDRGKLGGSQEGYSALPAVFSPDGKQIVSASADKRIRVWDADTGKCLRVLETFKDVGRLADHHLILDACFLPGGRQIAGHVWGTEKTLVVWDAATGQELRRLDLGADHHKDLAISPDGRWFITAHEDRTVRLRDLTTGEEIHRFDLADVYVPRGLAFSPDGRYAAAGSHRGWVYLWRLPKGPEKVSERIPDREHHAVPEGGVSPPHTPKGKLSDIDLKPEANQKLAGQIGRPPFLQQIVRVAWDGEQFEPRFLGRRGIEEKDLGRIMRDEETWEQEYEKEHMDGKGMGKPAPRGQPVRRVVRAPAYCKGLAFHPDGRTAFSEGYGSNRDMRLAFWKETGQIAPVVDLRLSEQYPKTEEARNAQERQGLFWFFAGPLAFDKSGTCYFSPGPVGPGNGIYRVNSARPVDIQKLYAILPNWALQIPSFDPEHIYSTSWNGVTRYSLRPADGEKPLVWFQVQPPEVGLMRSLVLSATKLIAEVGFAPDPGKPGDGLQFKTLLFDKETRGMALLADAPLGPMAISWDGKRMVCFDAQSKSVKEFSFTVEGKASGTFTSRERPREPVIEAPGRTSKPPVSPQAPVPPGPYVVGKLDPADIAAILELVRSTPENVDRRILRIVVEKPDQVVVWTGFQRAPLAGRGSTIQLKKVGGKWKIVKYGHWMS